MTRYDNWKVSIYNPQDETVTPTDSDMNYTRADTMFLGPHLLPVRYNKLGETEIGSSYEEIHTIEHYNFV
eukprot:CAMPEP_0170567234 /NCGR_PEP_ID=MMETSP0211-20121228/80350_1 /TAXON_ID=311385 /ORGANISM="Pseudokeronopsis sp., Strain OXSARD2" /LENGTH=69 /DNA_ID=CAMNT_0010888631 /DNA_START=971 /DNA_END=1180 /DNA_ORIENTATION=-